MNTKSRLLSLFFIVMTFIFSATPIFAANFSVNTEAQLIAAINTSNGNAQADIITLTANITLSAALPQITSEITIEGGDFTLDGNGNGSVLYNNGGTLTINNLTITGGTGNNCFATAEICGGGVFAAGGTVTINNSTLSGNSAQNNGGGIYAESGSTVIINNSTLSGNSTVSTVSTGGGIFADSNVTITNSTLSGNSTTGRGGGIYHLRGIVTVDNSTITGNSADNDIGGGIYKNSHVSGSVTVSNSIIANNTASLFHNCTSNVINGGNNLSELGPGACPAFLVIVPGTDYDTTLADNGGPTQTHALFFGSPAIDGSSGGTSSDQRGILAEGTRDIGAYEYIASPDLTISKSNNSSNESIGAIDGASWEWFVTVSNLGDGDAVFGVGNVVFSDQFPTSNISYSSLGGSGFINVSGYVDCSVTSGFLMSCYTDPFDTGTIGARTGEMTMYMTATTTVAGTYTNPTGGNCRVDPGDVIIESDETNNDCTANSVIVTAPDLEVTKTNGSGGTTNLGDANSGAWAWMITLDNTSAGLAEFASGETIFTDNLPDTNISYSAVTVDTVGSTDMTNPGNVSCSIDASFDLICTANGAIVGFAGTTGSISLSFTATPTVEATYDNPRSGGACSIDPSGNVAEDDTSNNTCSDSVIVSPSVDLSITKDDGVTSVTQGGLLIYTIVVSNAGPSDDPNVTVSDILPASLTATYTSVAAGGATGNTASGSGNISETLSMPSGSSVTYTVVATVDAAATGTISNTATVTSSITDSIPGNNSATDDDTLITLASGFSKAFSPDTMVLNGTSTLTFTIDNTANAIAVTNLDFTDNLPAGLVIATPSNAATTCTGGTVTAVVATGVVSYTGGTVPASSSCTITVDVTSVTAATYVNITGDLTSSAGNSGTASDTLIVVPAPLFTKSFSPDPIVLNATSTLTLTIDNTASVLAATNLDFTDNLPADLVIATPSNASTTCIGGTITAVAGAGVVSYTGGSVSASSSCIITVDVTSATATTYTNTTNDLTSSLGNSGTASDTITVADELAIGKEFTNDPVLTSGGTVILEFTILNPDTTNPASNIAFTDDLTAVLAGLQATSVDSNTCSGTVDISTATQIVFTGGSLAVNSSCTISLSLLVPLGSTRGAYLNTTSSITGIVGLAITGNVATDSLIIRNVPASPIVSISNQQANISLFDPAISKIGFLLPGQVGVTGEELEWIVTVSNTGAVVGNNVIITDTLIDALQIDSVDAPGASVNISGQTVSVTYATLNVGETVQFSIFTTVLNGVEVSNTACVTADNQAGEECATGLAVGELPQTGESPFWYKSLLIVSVLCCFLLILLHNQRYIL